MASGFGTIGIVLAVAAIAVASAFTFGAAAVAAGAATASFTVAGVGISGAVAFQAGVLALGAGLAIMQASSAPDPTSQVARQLVTTDDPEGPWEWVYGDVIKAAMRPWEGVGGNKDKYAGCDDVLACHPCEELVSLQVGEWYLPIVTSNAGSATANGVGLILNQNRTVPYEDVPSGWYVPVEDSPFNDNDQSQVNNNDKLWHIAVRFRPGDQTATEAFMGTIFGTKYTDENRKFIGHTVCHVITRARTNIGLSGPVPQIIYRVRGKNNVRNHAGTQAYRANTAHVFADYCREQLGIQHTAFVNLQAVAGECDDTSWDPQGTAARYEFHGVIRDDMDIQEALRLISAHMAGGWSERGDQVVLWSGTIKTPWSGGPLTPDDFAGPVAIMPPDEDSWANTLTPHFVPRTAQDEEGDTMLYGKMEPSKNDVTSATYVTEDGGEVLRQDIKFQACPLSRRAKFMSWVALKQMRLGATYSRKFKKRAMVLEVGDVVAVNDPDFIPDGTLFQVASKSGPDPRDFTVDLGLVRYENAIYTPGAVVSEDAIGIVPINRGADIPPITGLAAQVLEGSAQVQADGTITVDVQVEWDAVDNFHVNTGGDIRVAWKKTSESWPRKATTVSGDEIHAVLPGLVQATAYHIRARAEGAPAAGREGKPRGPWTADLSFTPDSGFTIMPGPPGSASWGDNLVDNPSFERGSGGSAPHWEAQLTSPATFLVTTTGGKFGTRAARITFNGSTASQYLRTDSSGPYGGLIPVEPGQRYLIVYWARTGLGTVDDVEIRANLQFYGGAGQTEFIQTDTTGSRIITSAQAATYIRMKTRHSVPNDQTIAFMRLQAAAEPDGTNTTFIQYDGFRIRRQVAGTSTMVVSAVSLNTGNTGSGLTWTSLRSITGSTPGDAVTIRAQFEARWGDAGSASGDTFLQLRIVRYDLDGTSNETIIKTETVGDGVPPGTSWNAWGARAFVAIDDTGAQGTYIWRCQFRSTGANGQVQTRDRVISWALEEESTSS